MISPVDVSASLLHLVRVGLLTLSEERVIETLDSAALKLVAGPGGAAALVGQVLEVCVQPLDSDGVNALSTPPPYTYVALATASSAQCLVHVSRSPRDASGGLVAAVVSVNEYLAEARSLAHVQLRNTVQSIIAGFAHEVRNPLAAILSLTEAALQQDPSPDTVLVRIPSLVARVESLIKQSLAYSRPKSPNRALHHPSFLLEHAIALLRPRTHAVTLDFVEAKDIPPVMVDLPQGEQILVNLLENALDAAKSQVQIRVRAGRTPVPSVCIEVTDDGPGVAPDAASRIFDPFFTTKAHGTGLGLAIARDLTRLNGGDLRWVPSPRGGATFRMYLPSTQAPLLGTASI